MNTLAVKRLTVYPLALKMRRTVAHAAAQRAVSEPIVVAVELMNGAVGYGETLPRPYVTGETSESVLELLGGEFVKELLAFRPRSFPEALEALEALPMLSEAGMPCPAARAGIELALLDGVLRSFERGVEDVTGWMGLVGFGMPGSTRTVRYGVVLASATLAKLRKNIRLAKLAGIRDFKVKVGFADDGARRKLIESSLGRSAAAGRTTIRLDANAAWTLPEAVAAIGEWSGLAIAGVEQPLPVGRDKDLPALRSQTSVPIFHDESLVTLDDARRLHGLGVADGFNIRLSKCGGLLPSLRLAEFARSRGIAVQLGCMVGETSILSAAGVRFLEAVPGVRFVEGCYGGLLMAEDVVRRSLRFGLGGRLPRLGGAGWGDRVEAERLRGHCVGDPVVVEL